MTKHPVLAGAALLAVGAGLGVAATLYWHPHAAQGAAGDGEPQLPEQHAPHEGPPTITLPAEAAARAGVTSAALAAATEAPAVAALGQLEADPASAFVVRAPIAGTLLAAPDLPWPRLGATLAGGAVLGSIAPRLTAVERADLEQRALAAENELANARTSSIAAEKSAVRARALNADGKNVSDRELEEAEARVALEAGKQSGAAHSLAQLRALLAGAPAALPLSSPGAGEVAECLAMPGESVEAGQPLLRVSDRTRLVARITLPLGLEFDAAATTARLALPTSPPSVQVGKLAGHAANGTVVYEFAPATGDLRPGQPVTAWLPQRGATRDGVVVPRSAIVRLRGHTFVFVQLPETPGSKAARFVLRRIESDRPTEAGCFVPTAAADAPDRLAPGDPVVLQGAAVLLSYLLRHEIPETNEPPAEGK